MRTYSQHLILSAPVTLSLRVDHLHIEHNRPGLQPIVGYGTSILMGERVLSTCDYTYGVGAAFEKGTFFADPLRLALLAQQGPGRERGLLRVALAAAPTTPFQEAEALEIQARFSEDFRLWTLPENQVGVPLGEHWLAAGEDVLTPVCDGPDLVDRLSRMEARFKPFFDRILYGDPGQEVKRLLASVSNP